MKKVKSVTDVITNSSTEVFLLETTKSPSEVEEILKTLTTGFSKPVILNSGEPRNPLARVKSYMGFYGYLYSSSNPHQYIWEVLGKRDIDWIMESSIPSLEWVEWKNALCDYVWERREGILEALNKEFPRGNLSWVIPSKDLALTNTCYLSRYLPGDFMEDFLKSTGKGLPDFLVLPENRTIEYWEGKVGFSGKDDNSIPWEDFEKILDIFGGSNYHLG